MPKVCPKCLSTRITLDWELYLGGYSVRRHKCLDCEYVGAVVLDVEEKELKKMREEMEQREAESRRSQNQPAG